MIQYDWLPPHRLRFRFLRWKRRFDLGAFARDRVHIDQPKVSALADYKLDGFSVERLMIFLTALDQDVEIVIRNKPR